MKKLLLLGFFLLVVPLFLASSVLAQNNRQTMVVLPPGETVNKDYFAAGNSVTLSGTVNGDAYVAGGNVVVEGTINGDLLVAGGTVNVRGRVANNVRAAGGQVIISGDIGRNVSTAGGSTTITDAARIGGSLAAAGGSLEVFAPIAKDLNLAAGQATLGNTVGGDVMAQVGQLTLTPKADVSGNLTYISNTPAQIQSGAKVNGTITQNRPPQQQVQPNQIAKTLATFALVVKLMYLVSYLIVGLLLIRFFPLFIGSVADNINRRFWPSLGWGLLILILTPIIIFFLFITVLGIPLALILLAVFWILIFLSKIFVSLVIGQRILGWFGRRDNWGWALFLGVIVYLILTLIPILGGLITFIVTLLGLGAWLLGGRDYYNLLRDKI
jgi:hypothetical protein